MRMLNKLAVMVLLGLLSTASAFASDLELQWRFAIDQGLNHTESPGKVISDSQGNIYFNGYAHAGGQHLRTLTKLNKDGALLWNKKIDVPSLTTSVMDSTLAFDNEGNILTPSRKKKGFDILTFSPNGDLISTTRGRGAENVALLEIDDQNNQYIAGDGKKGNWSVIKTGTNGKAIWKAAHPGTPTGIALDYQGNLYVSGEWQKDASSRITGLIVKYGKDGQELWSIELTDYYKNMIFALEAAADGGVVIAGAGFGYSTVGTWVINKYNSDGTLAWNGPYPVQGRARDVDIGSDGSVYVTGDLMWGTTGSQIHQYSADGILQAVEDVDVVNNPLESIDVNTQHGIVVVGRQNTVINDDSRDYMLVHKYLSLSE